MDLHLPLYAIPQPAAPKLSEATVRAFESEEEIYRKLIANQEKIWYYGDGPQSMFCMSFLNCRRHL